MNHKIKVEIVVTPEQVEKLKVVLSDLRADGRDQWRDWKDYASTVAELGFLDRLENRYASVMRHKQGVSS